MIRSEHEEQVAVFDWIYLHRHTYPGISLAFAIPNGGHRHKATAARLKAEGVRKGVPDIFVPVARGLYNGLFIEMKKKGRPQTTEQKKYFKCLEMLGYLCVVCYSCDEVADVIDTYYRDQYNVYKIAEDCGI
jgi:hypothetical protein